MKKILCILHCFLITTTVLAQKPVVYLPMNGDLNDATANALHAESKGAMEIKYISDPQRGTVAEFPIGAYAQLPVDERLDFSTKNFTVGFWTKLNASVTVDSDPVFLSNKNWDSGGNPGFAVILRDGNASFWRVNVGDGANRLDWKANENGAGNIKDGKWHFVVVTFDRTNTMNVYYDGVLKQTTVDASQKDLSALTGDLDAGFPITIMQDGTGTYGDDFAALMDDIFVYDRLLSDEEVLDLFQNGYNDPTLGADAYLPLDEDLSDLSGNNLHATAKGATSVKFVEDAQRGMVAEFPIGAYAQFPVDPKLDLSTDDFTISFWTKLNPNVTVDSDPVFLSNKNWDSGGNPGFAVILRDGNASFWRVNVGDGTSRLDWKANENDAANIKDGKWHFVAVAFNRGGTMDVYMDGVLKQTSADLAQKDLSGLVNSLHNNALPITIMQDGTGAYADDFAAMIDEVRIWGNKALNAQEVMAAFKYVPGGDGDVTFGADVFLPLDEDLGDIAGNLSPVEGGSTPVKFVEDPERGTVAFFDVGAFAQFPLDPFFEFGHENFTVSFWTKLDPNVPVDSDPVFLSNKDWDSGSNPGFAVILRDGNSTFWRVNAADGTSRIDWKASENNAGNVKDGKWHLITVAFDREDRLKVYYDGVLTGSSPETNQWDLTPITGPMHAELPLTIMQDGTGAYPADFAAYIDNVRIWKRLLTDQEVTELFEKDQVDNGEEPGIVLANEPKSYQKNIRLYPNPIQNIATLEINLSVREFLNVSIKDYLGRHVKTLANQVFDAGVQKLEWDVNYLKAGMYFIHINMANKTETIKCLINQ